MDVNSTVIIHIQNIVFFYFRDSIASNTAYLVSIDSQVFILSNRFHSVIAYMDCFIAANLLRAVMPHLSRFIMFHNMIKVFLCMNKDFFTTHFIFKTQFVKTIALMGFGFNRHAGFMFGKLVRGLCGTVIGTPYHNRLVWVTI